MPVEVKHLVPEVLDVMEIGKLFIFLKTLVCAVIDCKTHLLTMLDYRVALGNKMKFSVDRIVNSDLL